MDEFKAELAALRQELSLLREVALSRRKVDLVDLGPNRLFLYIDEAAYLGLPEAMKHQPANRANLARKELPARTAEGVYDDPDAPLLHLLLAHYWLHNLDFVYLDVGAGYGCTAIEAAQFIASCGRRNLVVAFEPGEAAPLVPFNIAANHLEEAIRFEPLAVTDGAYPTILFAELGHGENNRIVNRDPASENLSRVVQGVSVDDYLRRHEIGANLILKIDTQGAECEVVEGMRGAMSSRHVSFIIEYTPWALATRVDPSSWLEGLARDHFLFDVPGVFFRPGSARVSPIQPEGAPAFTEEVSRRPHSYTDLLALPKTLPGIAALLRRLGG